MANVLHHTYLPFTADQLREHFAPVADPGERDWHLRYYLASVEEARKYDELIRGGDKPTPAQTRLGRQMEKDERFWLVTALMSLYHADDGSGRGQRFARLLERAGLRPPPGFPSWEDALAGAWTCSSKSISHRLPATAPGSAIIWANASRSLTSKSGRKRRGRGWEERRELTPCCSLTTE